MKVTSNNETPAEMTPAQVAEALAEFNLWRRSVGKYAWSEDPAKQCPDPFSPKQLGQIIDRAVEILKTKDIH